MAVLHPQKLKRWMNVVGCLTSRTANDVNSKGNGDEVEDAKSGIILPSIHIPACLPAPFYFSLVNVPCTCTPTAGAWKPSSAFLFIYLAQPILLLLLLLLLPPCIDSFSFTSCCCRYFLARLSFSPRHCHRGDESRAEQMRKDWQKNGSIEMRLVFVFLSAFTISSQRDLYSFPLI